MTKTLLSLLFLALLMSLEEGATIVGENRNVYFSSPANASKRGCNWGWKNTRSADFKVTPSSGDFLN